MITMIIRWYHRNKFWKCKFSGQKIKNELLASTYLSFTLTHLAFSFVFLLSLSQSLPNTVFDYFFSIALLSVNLIQFRGYDIKNLEYSLSIFIQNIVQQFFFILCATSESSSELISWKLDAIAINYIFKPKFKKRMLLGTDYKTFYCVVPTQAFFLLVFARWQNMLTLVSCGNIFFFYGHFQDLSHLIT